MKSSYLLLLAFAMNACTSGSSGGGGAGSEPQVSSFDEPSFQVMGEIENPNWMGSFCDKSLRVDPRLKPNQKFRLAQIGKDWGGRHFKNTTETTITKVGSMDLERMLTTSNGSQFITFRHRSDCKEADRKVNCESKYDIVDTNILAEGSSIPKTDECHYQRAKDFPFGEWKSKIEVGFMKLGRDTISAVRSTNEYDFKSQCPGAKVVRYKSVRIETFDIPSPHASESHCVNTIYSRNGYYDKDLGLPVKEESERLEVAPSQSDMGAYPKDLDLELLYTILKPKEEKKNDPVPPEEKKEEPKVETTEKPSEPVKKAPVKKKATPTAAPTGETV